MLKSNQTLFHKENGKEEAAMRIDPKCCWFFFPLYPPQVPKLGPVTCAGLMEAAGKEGASEAASIRSSATQKKKRKRSNESNGERCAKGQVQHEEEGVKRWGCKSKLGHGS